VHQIDDSIVYGPGLRWALMGPILTFHLAGQGPPGATPGTFLYHDTHTIVSGTGALANLHGVLTLVGTVHPPAGPVATYTGEVHFDP